MEKALEAGAPLLPRYSEAAEHGADPRVQVQVALLQQQVSALQAAQDRRRRIGKAILFGVLGYFLLAPVVGRMVLPFLPNSVNEYDYGFTSEEYGYDLSNDMVVPDFDQDSGPEPLHPPFKHRPGPPGSPGPGKPEGKCIPAPMTSASEEELEQVFSALPVYDAERETAETDDDDDDEEEGDSDDDDEEAECENDDDEESDPESDDDGTEFAATPIDDSREGPRRPPGPPRRPPGPPRRGGPGRGRGRCPPGRGRRPGPPRGPGGPRRPHRPPFRHPHPPPHRGFPGRRPHPPPPHRGGPGGRHPPMPPHFPPPPGHGGPGRRPIHRRFPRFQEVPYEVIANGTTYEIRKYSNLTVAWASGNGTAAKPSFETMKSVFKYLMGSNNDTESGDCFMIPPVKPAFSLVDGEHAGQAILALPLPARLARVPTPLDSQVQIRVIPEFHAAVKKIEGPVTDEAIDKIFAELKDEVKDGYKVIGDAKPEVARYTPPWVPARWQRNEVLAPVKKA